MHARTQASAQVAGTGEDVAEMLIPHELPALLADVLLHILQACAEAAENSTHVTALLHGDDTGVVLLVHPDKEVLLVVVPANRERCNL